MINNQVLNTIHKEIIDSGMDNRYAIAAYGFVLNGLEFQMARIGEKRHLSGQEFSLCLIEFASKQFGPLALDVLNGWGITTTDDFGYLVYNLIDIGLMSKKENDTLQDFFNVADIAKVLADTESTDLDKNFIRSIKGA